jgi:hypothetical protein
MTEMERLVLGKELKNTDLISLVNKSSKEVTMSNKCLAK